MSNVDLDEIDRILDDFGESYAMVSARRYTFMSKVPKSNEWFNHILPQLDDKRFKIMLRVSRKQLSVILRLIENNDIFKGQNSCHQFPVSTQLALVLYRLGSNGDGASVPKMSALLGIGDGGTMDRITTRVFKVSNSY